jgi:hypothetical protein
VQVALDRPGASGEPPGQGLHARPAKPRLVVGVIGQGTVGRDHLRRDPGEYQVTDLGDMIHQSGGVQAKDMLRRFFYAVFNGFTLSELA